MDEVLPQGHVPLKCGSWNFHHKSSQVSYLSLWLRLWVSPEGWEMCFRKRLEIRKQKTKTRGYQNSEDNSEVIVSLPFWEFQLRCLKVSSWQQGLCVGWREGRAAPPSFLLPWACWRTHQCLHCHMPLSLSVPGADDAAAGFSYDFSAFFCSS